jgi:hypothetical protein
MARAIPQGQKIQGEKINVTLIFKLAGCAKRSFLFHEPSCDERNLGDFTSSGAGRATHDRQGGFMLRNRSTVRITNLSYGRAAIQSETNSRYRFRSGDQPFGLPPRHENPCLHISTNAFVIGCSLLLRTIANRTRGFGSMDKK